MILKFLLGHIPLGKLSKGDAEKEIVSVMGKKEAPGNINYSPRIICLDLETQKLARDVGGWHNAHLMRVSVAVIHDSLEGHFFTFLEDEIGDLLAQLEKADLIVGFNIKRFDYLVLNAYTSKDLNELNTFDILEDVHQRLGFRLSLDHLARETLNQGKTADGLMAVEWFRQGEMKKLTEYCLHDVATTRDLFHYGLKNGHLIYRKSQHDRRVRLRVDWNLDELIGCNG